MDQKGIDPGKTNYRVRTISLLLVLAVAVDNLMSIPASGVVYLLDTNKVKDIYNTS